MNFFSNFQDVFLNYFLRTHKPQLPSHFWYWWCVMWIVNTPLSLSLWPSRTTAIPDSASGTLTPAAIKVRPITVSGIPNVKPITVIIQTWKYNSIIRPKFYNSSHNLKEIIQIKKEEGSNWIKENFLILRKKFPLEKMVFCYQNCSGLLWEKIVLVIEKTFEIRGWRPRICKIFRSAKQFIRALKGENNFW